MVLVGRVKTGLGNASYWMKKAEKAFEKKLGKKLYNGTLNIELDSEYILDGDLKVLHKEDYGGNEDVFIKECEVLDHKSYIVRTGKNSKIGGDHPLNIIEIISEICFRDKYKLKDGDSVNIVIK